MIKLGIRTHPDVLFAYIKNHVELIMRVENREKETVWVETEVKVPDKLSLGPNSELGRGRVRIGIIEKKEYIEKSVRVYADNYTVPQVYRGTVILYAFNKNGIIHDRIEKPFDIRVETKKEASY